MVLSDGMVHFLKIEKILTNLPKLSFGFNPIVTHFFAQSQASGTALFWAIHM